MSVSATGGPGRPLHPAGNHGGGKRHGPSPADFPGVRGQDPAAPALPAEEGQPAKAGRDAGAGREGAAPASMAPHDAYAAYQLAKKRGDGEIHGAAGGAVPAHHPQEAADRFETGRSAAERIPEGPDRPGGLDVRA